MSIYPTEKLKINYSPIFDRLSLIAGEDFISLSITSFYLWMVLIEQDSDFERLNVNQQGSDVIFTKINGSFAIHFNSLRAIFNRIILPKEEVDKILESKPEILKKIIDYRRKQSKHPRKRDQDNIIFRSSKRSNGQSSGDKIDSYKGIIEEHGNLG